VSTLHLCGSGNPDGVRLALALMGRESRWDRLVLLDDDPATHGVKHLGVPVVGGFAQLEGLDAADAEAVNLVARTTARRRAAGRRIASYGIPFARLVSPDVDTDGVELADDVIIYRHVTLGAEARVGAETVAFSGAVIGHECRIESGCVIGSNAVLNARVGLGEGVYVGTNATVLPEISIGAWATVGAGSVVVEDVPAGATVMGVPAELVHCRVPGAHAAPDADTSPAGGVPAQLGMSTDEIEGTIAAIWCELLRVPRVDREGSFFELGGDSLLALRAREHIRHAVGAEIAVTDVFRFPSIRSLAAHLAGAGEGSRYDDVGRRASARRAAMRTALRHGN
jgi:sugar O-acyltransferase (sialic acid O-acetyltransferase NeuD family)